MTVLGPAIWVKVFGFAAPLVPLDPSTVVTMPVTFLACYLGSVLDNSRGGTQERAKFAEQYSRSAA